MPLRQLPLPQRITLNVQQDVLTDPKKRAIYDQLGEQGLNAGPILFCSTCKVQSSNNPFSGRQQHVKVRHQIRHRQGQPVYCSLKSEQAWLMPCTRCRCPHPPDCTTTSAVYHRSTFRKRTQAPLRRIVNSYFLYRFFNTAALATGKAKVAVAQIDFESEARF